MTATNQSGQEHKSALVIGGGIMGLTTAYALGRSGVQVTLLDDGVIDQRASSATAGIIGGSSVIPWASSALWPRLPKHILERHGPLRMAMPLPKGVTKFFARSVQAGSMDARATSAAGLANLGLPGWDAWQELLSDLPEARALFIQNGCLFYYETAADQLADEKANAVRRGFGMDLSDLDQQEMRAKLPTLKRAVAAGTKVNSAGHVVDPVGLQQKLVDGVTHTGGKVIAQRVSELCVDELQVTTVMAGGTRFEADAVVLCAGSGSAPLARDLGLSIPMVPAWGASVTFVDAAVDLEMPFLVLSDGFAVTPSTAGLRISGLLQVGGAGKAEGMIATLIDHAKRLFGNFAFKEMITCAGPRPLSADSLAFLGPDPKFSNLFHNFGHGHWGLTQAAISAQVTADLVLGKDPKIDISPYRPDRY